METTSIITIIFTIIVIAISFVKRKISKEEIENYQKTLNESAKKTKDEYGIEVKYNAKEELNNQSRINSCFIIFGGAFFIVAGLMIAIFFGHLEVEAIITMCLCSMFLILYGMIKIAESKKKAIIMLGMILTIGLIGNYVIENWIKHDSRHLYILIGSVIVLGLFSTRQFRKKTV